MQGLFQGIFPIPQYAVLELEYIPLAPVWGQHSSDNPTFQVESFAAWRKQTSAKEAYTSENVDHSQDSKTTKRDQDNSKIGLALARTPRKIATTKQTANLRYLFKKSSKAVT